MINSVDETGDHFESIHRRRDGSIYDVEISTNAANLASPCLCDSGIISSTVTVNSTPAVKAKIEYSTIGGCPLTSK